MTSNRGGSLAAAGAGRAAGRLRRAGPRRCLDQLCGIQSDYRSRHLVEFSNQLVPDGIVREDPPLALAQAGRILRILDYSQRINLLLHIVISPIYLASGPPSGSLQYTASRPHYYRPVPPRPPKALPHGPTRPESGALRLRRVVPDPKPA